MSHRKLYLMTRNARNVVADCAIMD